MTELAGAAVARPARKQQQRSIVTQQKLLDAAIEAFSENGFKGTSTRDIAERAGVHHPLITYHFKNKDQLWRAAADRVFTEFNSSLQRALDGMRERDPKTRFAQMIRTYVEYAYNLPAIHKVLVQESSYPNPRIDWLVATHLRPFYKATDEYIRELQELGVMPQGNPALIYHMIWLCAGGLLALNNELRVTSGTDLQNEGMREQLCQMIERVFLPGEVGASA